MHYYMSLNYIRDSVLSQYSKLLNFNNSKVLTVSLVCRDDTILSLVFLLDGIDIVEVTYAKGYNNSGYIVKTVYPDDLYDEYNECFFYIAQINNTIAAVIAEIVRYIILEAL